MSSIWFAKPTIEQLNQQANNTAVGHLGIKITEVGDDYLRGTMPADSRTFQPFGVVHGGCNVVLAETLGSVAANMLVDHTKYYCFGQEVNANHLRSVSKGEVIGTARCLHHGRTSQVWEIHIEDDQGRLTCVSRLTMAVLEKR